MIFKPLKKKKKFGLNQTSTPSQSPTVNATFSAVHFKFALEHKLANMRSYWKTFDILL